MPILTAVISLLILFVCPCAEGRTESPVFLALPGYSGIMNIPSAHLVKDKSLSFLYNEQLENRWRGLPNPRQRNYLLTLGLLPYVEFGGRLTDAESSQSNHYLVRDISANIKLKVPFIPEYLPQVAVGMTDIGGGARYFHTDYAVMTYDIWRFSLSAGYGRGPDQLKGYFGGAEARVADWCYLLGEYDTNDTNLGLRLTTPPGLFPFPLRIAVTAKTSLDYRPGNVDAAFLVQIPLGSDHYNIKPMVSPEQTTKESASAPAPVLSLPAVMTEGDATAAVIEDRLQSLRYRLVADGFQNVRIGWKETTLYLEYENNRYNHNELDGLGVALGRVAELAPDGLDSFVVVLKKTDVPTLRLVAPIQAYRAFLRDASRQDELRESLRITKGWRLDQAEGVRFVKGDTNSTALTTSLVLYPHLSNFIGTEIGLYDYLLSLKANLSLNLWKGGIANVRYALPVAWSANYDRESYNGYQAFRKYRTDPDVEQYLFNQTFSITPSLTTLVNGGMLVKDNYGFMDELRWEPGKGSHLFSFKVGTFHDSNLDLKREVYLGSYRYWFAPLDLSIKGTYGRFWNRDKGFTAELKRFFGDTAVDVYYKRTDSHEGVRQESAGIIFSFPLTPRRDMKPGVVQLRGIQTYDYNVETAIARKGEANYINTGVALTPVGPVNLDMVYFNRDRLREEYVLKHLLRLRDTSSRWNGANP